MKPARLPRFKRSLAIAPFRLTDRDREILRLIHRHRFLRSDHLTALLPGSPQRILRRLQQLYHHGYLERPISQLSYYRSGSRCMAYGIWKKGAALLERELSIPSRQLDWTRRSRPGDVFLEHALMVSDFTVALELACRVRKDVRLIRAEEITWPDDGQSKREPFRWRVNVRSLFKCEIVPDGVFGLQFIGKSSERNTAWFFFEADRGTMPVTRATLNQSSFYRKLLGYEATWTQDIHRRRFGWQRFRVLTITSKPDRVQSLLRATRTLHRGHGLFLFSDHHTLREQPNFFALPWRTCRDDKPVNVLN